MTGRLETLARAVERSRRRRWDVRRVLLVLGAVLMGVGFMSIGLGWYGAANSAYVFQQLPYLISGGVLGLALVAAGGFLFFSSWLVRVIEENRRHAARVAQTLDRVDRLLGSLAEGADAPSATPPPVSGGGWT